MNRAVTLLLFLSTTVIGAEEKNPVQIKEDDIKELEALKKQSNESTPQPIKVNEGVTITPLTSDVQELEALKKQMGDETKGDISSKNLGEKLMKVRYVQGDEEDRGVELFLYNDGNTVPVLFLIQATGHEIGEKISVTGQFEGAQKFERNLLPVI
jgi:hypothetical protein